MITRTIWLRWVTTIVHESDTIKEAIYDKTMIRALRVSWNTFFYGPCGRLLLELLHQSCVMSIQPPPLLCQPLTCLISSGSSPPLSIPGLLHISFKQVLLQDSNPDQSNIVQGSIFYRGCLEIRVGHGSGPSIGRIGLGRVGSRQCQTYLINVPFICKKSSTIILNNNKL